MDDTNSNFVLYIETELHFLVLSSFKSIFSMPVWNTTDDRYSVFVLYIVTKPHFLTFAYFQNIFSKTVWNTFDVTYSSFVLYIVTKPHFLVLVSFQNIFSTTVLNTIDVRYSNFVLYIEMKPHFFILPLFKLFSVLQRGILSMIDTPIFILYRNEPTSSLFSSLFCLFIMLPNFIANASTLRLLILFQVCKGRKDLFTLFSETATFHSVPAP